MVEPRGRRALFGQTINVFVFFFFFLIACQFNHAKAARFDWSRTQLQNRQSLFAGQGEEERREGNKLSKCATGIFVRRVFRGRT